MKQALFLLIPSLLFAQSFCEISGASIFGTEDSVIMINEVDPGLYSGLIIRRGTDTVFTYSDDIIEIEAYAPLFKVVESAGKKYLVFRTCGRPSEGGYLVFGFLKNGYKLTGEIPRCTIDIFGDIDMDGIIEIGPTNPLHEGGQSQTELKKYYMKNMKVLELKDKFPVDTSLTELIINKIAG